MNPGSGAPAPGWQMSEEGMGGQGVSRVGSLLAKRIGKNGY